MLRNGKFGFNVADYWAKQAARLVNTPLCKEGKANRATSVYGQCVRYLNPPQATRDQYPQVDWSLFGLPPEEGSGTWLQENVRVLSNSSQQTAAHTEQTRWR